tara:strand:+ start:512 stop:1573 length:1062 start_codon:yes stop_codon:yes gene_type:complete
MDSSITFVGVIFGGESLEHDISIKSAQTIISGLSSKENKKKFKLISFYIDQKGRWWGADIAEIALKKGSALSTDELPQIDNEKGFLNFPKESNIVEIWFPILHGPNGEDGTIQGLLKLTGKPFVGSGVLGSAVGMDKIMMKTIFKAFNLPQVKYMTVIYSEVINPDSLEVLIQEVEETIGYPCFIKPANLGSSFGINKANNKNQLIKGLKEACKLDNRLVIEKGIEARELECGILGNDPILISSIGEIMFESEWYDFETKYKSNKSKMIIPASIPKSIISQIETISKTACKAINAYGIGRVDFFYVEETNKLYINEINTFPGFTISSMYPNLWKEAGLSIEDLVAKLVEIAKE